MEKFDQKDEEDDFNGVDQGSRAAIADVEIAIRERIKDRGFRLVLHNGGNKGINVADLGLAAEVLCTVFWTFRVRFRVDPKLMDKVVWNWKRGDWTRQTGTVPKYNDYYRYRCQSDDDGDSNDLLLRAEAEEVARKHGIDPAIVFQCFTYMLDRVHMSLHNIDHDWALHACNYWVCDGIIPQAHDGIHETWQLGEALHRDMEFCIDYLSSPELSRQGCTEVVDGRDLHLRHMRMSDEQRPYFISTETCGFILNPAGIVPDNKFQHSDTLRVLKLSRCTFRFTSPPFLCCHSLRFLCLDHCRDLVSSSSSDAEEEDTARSWPCFQNLWVLDLRYTHWDEILSAHMLDLMTQLRELNVMGAQNWDMSHLNGRLSNICKLRVTKSTCCNSEEARSNNLFFEMEQNIQGMTSLSGVGRSSTSLKTVTVDACVGLENISFRGCQELKDLFFTGLFASLEELDLSNTAIKFLDLKNVEAAHLKRLILLGCKKLRVILWPPKDKRAQYLEVLRIDNTQYASSCRSKWEENIKEDRRPFIGSLPPAGGKEKQLVGSGQAASFDFSWYVSISDARLLRSIVPFEQYLKGKCVCIEMDSCPASNVFSASTTATANEGEITMLACPPAPTLMAHDCYFHIQDEETMGSSTSMASPPALICNITNVLHVHDSLSITGLPFPPDSEWNRLEWCKVERCPKLRSVFYTDKKWSWSLEDKNIVPRLRTFWASQLPEVQHIWSWSPQTQPSKGSFHCLEFLHFDCCPKLISVLTMHEHTYTALSCLETLEIVCCDDLMEVFPCQNKQAVIKFPRLRHIHLDELPVMKQICGAMILAPVLESVKIRGCRSLRRLLAITGNAKLPKVDCEKEWWENLEWDGMQANHHPSLYFPSHSSAN